MQAARGASLTDGDRTRRRRLRLLLLTCAATAYGLDLLTKHLAVTRLDPGDRVPLVGDVLRLTLVRNPGAAFSTGTSFTVGLSVLAIVAVVVVLVLARRVGSTGWAVALGLLLGGVAGNLTDRIFRAPGVLRGHVVDFLQLPNWPVFNLADVSINAAAVLIVWQSLRGRALDGSRPDETDGREARRDPGDPGDPRHSPRGQEPHRDESREAAP
jgi:signal peptidase II